MDEDKDHNSEHIKVPTDVMEDPFFVKATGDVRVS